MKAPKSAGKSVKWAVRFVGTECPMSGTYHDKAHVCYLKKRWEKHNPNHRYELVKITTEPVAETKSTKQTKRN